MNKVLIILLLSTVFLSAKQNIKNYSDLKNYTPLDFGAKGDGKNDDSQALIKALEFISKTNSKQLLIPNDYVFNLGSRTIDFRTISSGIILDFDGGYLKNGALIGYNTKIKAERIKIFENIKLSEVFLSVNDYADRTKKTSGISILIMLFCMLITL